MTRDQFVFFWGGPFSQWAKYRMEIKGKTYVTCEQYMMAEKARKQMSAQVGMSSEVAWRMTMPCREVAVTGKVLDGVGGSIAGQMLDAWPLRSGW